MKKDSAFSFKRSQDSPGFVLWQVTTLWQRGIIKTLKPFGLTHPQFVILAITCWLEEHQIQVTQLEIIKRSKLDKMTVSKSLKNLEFNQFVKRKTFLEDTRSKTIQLTPKGLALIKEVIPKVEGLDHEFFASLDNHQNKMLLDLMQVLICDE
jgi:DNA-binding MarR family transcriptional regulator